MSAPLDLPIDQEDRDAVRTRHNVGVFVEAGAGTGKTHTIVRRIVSMVADGALELRELAAITFTEAAAAELRDRIRDSLERAAAGADPDVTEPIPQERCRVALAQVDEAALTTIHGFAQRLLAEHPLEAGLPPGFEVLDPIRARVELEQRWSEFVDDLYEQPDLEDTLLRGLMLGIGAAQLHGIALLLHENHDRLPELDEPPALPPLDATPVLAALDQLIAHRPSCIADADNLAQRIDATAPPLRARLEGVDSELDLIDVLTDAQRSPLKCRQGRKDSWRGSIDDVRDATEAVDAAVTKLLDDQRRAVLARLTGPVVAFVRRAAAERRAAGTLEFHDLLVLARDVLRADASVRAALGSRYRCVMLDEFQDTDPLQIEIAALVTAADPSQPASEWRNRPLRDGGLVLVGDPKQSIYRFRRADMAVFHDAQRTLGLEPRSLTENFRSVPGILEFVNALFAELLVEADGIQARHVDLHPHRAPVGPDVPVAIFGDVSPDSIGEIREVEADAVATLARRIKQEKWLVVDPDTGEEREAHYHDIALLIPSRTVLPRSKTRSSGPTCRCASRASHSSSRRPTCATSSQCSPRSTIQPTRSRSWPRCAPPRSAAAMPTSSSTCVTVADGTTAVMRPAISPTTIA